MVQESTGYVRVGNGMLQAARELGWTHLAAIYANDDDIRATMRAVVDNRSSQLSTMDPEILDGLLTRIEVGGFDLSLVGFTVPEREGLFGHPNNRPDVDHVERAPSELPQGLEHRVIVHCDGEKQQAEIFERLRGEGLRVSMLLS